MQPMRQTSKLNYNNKLFKIAIHSNIASSTELTKMHVQGTIVIKCRNSLSKRLCNISYGLDISP